MSDKEYLTAQEVHQLTGFALGVEPLADRLVTLAPHKRTPFAIDF